MSELKIKISETGADEVSKKLADLEKEIEKLKKSSEKNNKAVDDQKKGFEQLNKSTITATDNFQKVTSVAGSMGEGISKVAGQLGTMKTAFEGATGLIAGPWGLALGAGLAALAAFNLVTEEAAELQKQLKRSFVDSVSAIQSLEGQIKAEEEALKEHNRILGENATAEERRIRLLANQRRAIEIVGESNDTFATTVRNVTDWLDRNANSVGILRTKLELKAVVQRELNRITEENTMLYEANNRELMENLRLQSEMNNAALTARGLASRAGVPQTMPLISQSDINAAEARRLQREEQERERARAEAERRRAEREREELREFTELTRTLVEYETAADVERRRAIEEQNMLLEEQLDLAGKIAEQKRLRAEEEEAIFLAQTEQKFKLDEEYQKEQSKLAKDRAKQEQVVGNAIQNLQGLTMQAIELAKQEGVTRKEAFASALDAWLKGFAIEQAFKGAENTINAIASYARYDYAAGSQFLAAAAGNFALAAAAGGASAAIPNVGGGGGPEERRTETPEPEESRNVVINIQGTPLLDRAQIGRTIQQAMSEADRRY